MARRKRQFLDDDDDSDSYDGSEDGGPDDFGPDGNADERDERELFENPYKRGKRRKTGGKDDATYGVFADDSEDEGFGGRKKKTEKRTDWTKAPSFVSGEKSSLKETTGEVESVGDDDGLPEEQEQDEENEALDGAEEDDSSASDSASTSKSPPARTETDESESRPRFGGIGSSRMDVDSNEPVPLPSGIGFKKSGIGLGFQKSAGASVGLGFKKGDDLSVESDEAGTSGGIGFSKGSSTSLEDSVSKIGLGSQKAPTSSSTGSTNREVTPELPSSFSTSRQQRSFVREKDMPKRSATPLSAQERAHFNKLQGSFGARMLSKMGWEAGSGLGTEGVGIVTPIESKLRPKNMGIAYKGFGEKTDQSKAEARRRGEKVSDDEDEDDNQKRKKGKAKNIKKEREDAWKKPKKSRVKVEHKTYEEIIAEAGDEPAPSGVGIIIDATGSTMREVSSLADISGWTPSMDPTRMPEVRHNLRMISDACKTDLTGLAREAKALEDRKKWIDREDPKLRRKVEEEAELIRRLQAVRLVVDDINSTAKQAEQSDYEPSLDVFNVHIEKLVSNFAKEYESYKLDEIVVAAITPIFRRMMASWHPKDDPSAFTSQLRRWKTALKTNEVRNEPGLQVDIYGMNTVSSRSQIMAPMTPYESLLWNVWLPRVRSFINNEWSPYEPQQAVKLFEAWGDILPTFVQDNVLDQLILPKISSAIANWSAKRDNVSLQAIVFPWLPHVGLRMEEFVDVARRKVKSQLRSWVTSDGVPKDLRPWREVFKSTDWESTLLKYVVPKLGATLRDEFRVNPRNQDMLPLQHVLEWSDIIRPSVFGQLLETEYFPKWLDVLHIWLIQPSVNFEEVAQWYSFWKGSMPEDVRKIPAVEAGFTRGLQLINQALELGPDAPKKLPKPDRPRTPPSEGVRNAKPQRTLPSRMQEITFKSIVEDFVASHNLLLLPAGKVHEKSRMPLFRVTKTVEGKTGLLIYLLDDAVWASDGDEYRAIPLEDIVLRATKTR